MNTEDDNITYQLGNVPSDIKISDIGKVMEQIPEALLDNSRQNAKVVNNNTNNKENNVRTEISTKQRETSDFNDRIHDYIKKNNPHVCILTPCYGSVCYVNYVHCLMNTITLFNQLQIKVTIEFCKNDSLVSRARNNLVAKAMANLTVTHIIFIDSDITWDPIDIVKLMISDKSLVGGVYPLKKYMWEKIIDDKGDLIKNLIEKKNKSSIGTAFTNESYVQHNLLRYNTNFLDNVVTIENNLAKVRHIATGFMMFKRSTIEQMFKAYPNTKYTDDVGFLHGDENKYAYALFDCGVEDDHYFSEDWMFCHRWSKMGGNIYVDVSINLIHTGLEDYRGSFIASIA
jgi:hypothetical protein